MKAIRTIIKKEWSEVFKNRMVLLSMTLVPLLLTALPLVMLATMKGVSGDISMEASASGVPPKFLALCEGMNGGDCLQAYILSEFMLMFMLMPTMIPVTIAAYSIVGEKNTRSLEPLLATPISTFELLAGKCLAAVIPAILITYLSFGVFNLSLLLMGMSAGLRAFVLAPAWLLGILLLGPIVSVISVVFALFVSSRVSDPRVAEQLSGVVILPIMGMLFMQLAGVLVVNQLFMLIAIVFSAILAVAMLYLGTIIFDRENILTKWK